MDAPYHTVLRNKVCSNREKDLHVKTEGKISQDYRMRQREEQRTERLAGSKYHIERSEEKTVSDLKQLFLNQGKQTK